jgi:hypothetical protein
MKSRKKSLAIAIERRNTLYNKTILHNRELAEKNTELSHTIDHWKEKYNSLYKFVNRKRWWQFWRQFTQIIHILNETEWEMSDVVPLKMLEITYFYNIPIWRKIKTITSTVTDIHEKVYPTICIDEKEWMTENLKETKFKNNPIWT